MSEMGDWINQLASSGMFTRPGNEITAPVPDQPGDLVRPTLAPEPTTAAPTPPSDTPADTTNPNDTTAISPSLRSWLLQQKSGYNVLTPEMYNYFGGDEILKQLQQFDPNARWTVSDIGGNEGGPSGQGLRLDFDPSKLPGVGGPGAGRSIYDTGFVPVYDNSNLHNADMTYDDPYFGRLTPYKNVVKPKADWWEYAAPLAVGLLAPYAAAGLAGAGIGGTAGLTSSVTGSGVAAGAGGTPWWAKPVIQTIPKAGTISQMFQGAPSAPTAPAPVHPATGDYNPAAYNSTGNVSNPSTDSQLVATQFADDPYGLSRSR